MDVLAPLKTGRQEMGRWVVRRRNILLVVSIAVALLAWEALIRLGHFPAFILPGPGLVWQSFINSLADGSLLANAATTLEEVLTGLLIGSVLATCLGYLLAKSRIVEMLLAPYLVASQAIPVVAIAPMLIIWFGPGMFSKILICALTVFFPILVNTAVGLHAVPENLRDLMVSLRATRRQILVYLEIPAALPVFLGGLRIGATLSVIGAVVGEFVGADRGLGFLINVARGRFDTALVFVGVIALVAMALALYGAVVLLETRLLAWQNSPKQP
jgi:NitT/TauT family transport system permease protein